MLDRGFKAWAERTARMIRGELGLTPTGPLAAAKLAAYLGVELLTPKEIPGLPRSVLDQLLVQDPWGWSAVTIADSGRPLVIYNPRKSEGRRASDITHELAHLVLDHEPGTLVFSQDGGMAMRSFNQKQEDEANWLAWVLLLPREALVLCRRRGLDPVAIANEYGVTEVLVTFRLSTTGVNRQFEYSARRARGKSRGRV
jgi:Zn-dependent peptidase ImmA (M78 family)